ncbi:DUF2147 domain-containing protein [Phenylobacterium sp. J367]|uniref:DUF2147 domain-containing protein n=1 Tax=Phenylobacterium sp. J367 TaxID=2898435 RepID=UPI002150D6D3|nr:DUF2147 domain-containing protein [Phenylobacterium sp. J367]MCR5877353.1 DUF2147 domain-containing protein [Phenylobacterium sp. J367]
MRLMLAAALALVATPALAADPVEGDWFNKDASARVKLAPCAGSADRLCGTIVWLKAPNDTAGQPKKDVNNPDAKLRARGIVGLPFLRDFKRAEPGRWTGGKIYDPESGKTYDSKLRLNGDGSLKLEGCVLMICQAQTWRRAA